MIKTIDKNVNVAFKKMIADEVKVKIYNTNNVYDQSNDSECF